MEKTKLLFEHYGEKLFNIGYSKQENPSDFTEHMHDFYEIYYFLSGDVTYFIEGHAYKIYPNDLLIINNQEIHKPVFNSNETYQRIVIHFSPRYLSTFQTGDYNFLYCFEHRKLGYYNKIDATNVIKYNLDDYFNNILTYANMNTDEDNLLAKTYFIQLLIQLNKIFKQKKEVLKSTFIHDKKINEIITFINNNINKPLSLDIIQKKCFVNKYYLCHLFKQNTGFTVMEYIAYKRIILAKDLLLSGKSATETCHEIGFQDYTNFYKTFKKLIGLSPKKFSQLNNKH